MSIFTFSDEQQSENTPADKVTLSDATNSKGMLSIVADHYGQVTLPQKATAYATDHDGTYKVDVDVVTNIDGVYVTATGYGDTYGTACDNALHTIGTNNNEPFAHIIGKFTPADSRTVTHKRGKYAGKVSGRVTNKDGITIRINKVDKDDLRKVKGFTITT